MGIPAKLSGSITIVLLVALGVFVYPWLLKRRGGAIVVGALTVMLTGLFYLFDDPRGVESTTSVALAVVWALLPLGTGLLVSYFQKKKPSNQ